MLQLLMVDIHRQIPSAPFAAQIYGACNSTKHSQEQKAIFSSFIFFFSLSSCCVYSLYCSKLLKLLSNVVALSTDALLPDDCIRLQPEWKMLYFEWINCCSPTCFMQMRRFGNCDSVIEYHKFYVCVCVCSSLLYICCVSWTELNIEHNIEFIHYMLSMRLTWNMIIHLLWELDTHSRTRVYITSSISLENLSQQYVCNVQLTIQPTYRIQQVRYRCCNHSDKSTHHSLIVYVIRMYFAFVFSNGIII